MSSREGERAMALDPQAQEVINLVIKSGRPAYNTLSPKDARQLFRETRPASTPTPAEIGAVKNLTADGPGGPIPLRVYRPADVPAGTPLPVLVYYHGGGWVIGDLDTHDVQCRQITAEAGITVVAVDYRLAPEHKFPAAVDDAWAATRWVVAHAGELGIDGRRVAVAGDSAGGNLAAVVALMARDEGAAYAARLSDAGVQVDYVNYGGMIHGFMPMGRLIATGNRATSHVAASLRQALR